MRAPVTRRLLNDHSIADGMPRVRLIGDREGLLVAVRRKTRVVKVVVGGRHETLPIEHVVGIGPDTRTREFSLRDQVVRLELANEDLAHENHRLRTLLQRLFGKDHARCDPTS